MTSAEKKDILLSYSSIDRRVSRLLEEKKRWEDKAVAVSPVYAQTRTGRASDKLSLSVCRILEIEREIDRAIGEQLHLRQRIEAAIAGLKDDKLRQLMQYRYIDAMTWERVAAAMHMDVRWVLRLHGRALKKLTIESHYPPVL